MKLRGFLHHVPAEVPEGTRLKIAHLIRWEHLESAHDATQRRLALHRQVSECAESIYMTWRAENDCRLGGMLAMIAIVHGGRDCDGVEVTGNVTLVPADWRAVIAWDDAQARSADGPYWWHITKPSDAAKVKPTWRDRVLEAHECGHPWSI
jgi:hypothetical protein